MQISNLLEQKWIFPLNLTLQELPKNLIKEFVSCVSKLENKYSLTLIELESQIKEAEKTLVSMIDDLVGDEYDMKGLEALKSLLKGGENSEK